jgi:hypothetical protein
VILNPVFILFDDTMQSTKNIPPEIQEIIEKTARRGATLNIDHVSRAYIIVGGVLYKCNNSLSKIKIKGVLGNSQIIIYHPPVAHTGLLIDNS